MARSITADFRNDNNRAAAERGVNSATIALGGLAALGQPVRKAAARLGAAFAAWQAARKQRIEDDRLWSIALTDARVMADLSRAMSREAVRDARYY